MGLGFASRLSALLIAAMLLSASTILPADVQGDKSSCGENQIYMKKISTGDKVCVKHPWTSEKLIERGYGVYYYDLPCVNILIAPQPWTGILIPPLDRIKGDTFCGIDDFNKYGGLSFITKCKDPEIRLTWECTVHWKNGTKTKITPDFDIWDVYKELEKKADGCSTRHDCLEKHLSMFSSTSNDVHVP